MPDITREAQRAVEAFESIRISGVKAKEASDLFQEAIANPNAGLAPAVARLGAASAVTGAGINLLSTNLNRIGTSGYFITRSVNFVTRAFEGLGLAHQELLPVLQDEARLLELSGITGIAYSESMQDAAESVLEFNRAVNIKRLLLAGAVIALAAVTIATYKAATAASTYESSIVRLQTQLGISDKSFGQASDQALRLAGDYGLATAGLSDASFAIQSAGLRGAQGIEATRVAAQLAAIQFGDTRQAGVLLAGAINAYGVENLSAARAGEILLATVDQGKVEARELTTTLGRLLAPASQLGVPLEDIGAAIATYTRLGVPTSEAVNAIRGAMFALIKPSSQAKDIFAEFGLTVEEVQRRVREEGIVETLTFLRNELGVTDEQFARIIPRIRGYGAALALTNDNAMLFEEIQGNITGSTGKLDEAVERVAATTSNKWAQATQTISGLFIKFGQLILPLVNEGLDTFNGLLDVAGSVFSFFFGRDKSEALSEFNERVSDLTESWGQFAKTDAEKQQIQIEAILKAMRDSRGDIDQFIAGINAAREAIEAGETTEGQNARFLDEIRTAVETGFTGVFGSADAAGIGRTVERAVNEVRSGATGAFANYDWLDDLEEEAIGTFDTLQRILGDDALDIQMIFERTGFSVGRSIEYAAAQIAQRIDVTEDRAAQLAAAAILRERDRRDAVIQTGEAYIRSERILGREALGMEALFAQSNLVNESVEYGAQVFFDHTRAVERDEAAHVLLAFGVADVDTAQRRMFSQYSTYIDWLREQASRTDDAAQSLREYHAEIERQLRIIQISAAAQRQLAEVEEQRFALGEVGFARAVELVYDSLVKGVADLTAAIVNYDGEVKRTAQGENPLIAQWREAERVAKQYFDNVRDQLDDQQRALTRASEDVVDLINRQFTERFLALAETANITADERRRIEVRLRAQRDLTLAEARRENREEQRRVEDRLEVEEDRRRRQEQEASNAIARLRGANVPTGRRGDPIHVVQDDSGATQASTGATTGTDGSTGTTTTTGTQTGADGAPPSAMPTPANQCNGDPNFDTFNTAAAQMRGAGLTPPPPRCDQLPLQIRGMWTAIRHRRAQDAAAAARLAAVQGTQGAPQVGDPDIGPPDPTPTPPNNDGIPEPGDAGFGGTGRTRTMTDDREIGEGRAATDAVKENTKAIKELAERINTGGFEGFGGGPTAGTRRSSTGHGQQYYVDPARGRL